MIGDENWLCHKNKIDLHVNPLTIVHDGTDITTVNPKH